MSQAVPTPAHTVALVSCTAQTAHALTYRCNYCHDTACAALLPCLPCAYMQSWWSLRQPDEEDDDDHESDGMPSAATSKHQRSRRLQQ
jgi:hypothetical protein